MLYNEDDKTRQGNLSDTYLLTTKIIACIWMISTNPWLATEHTISMAKEMFRASQNHYQLPNENKSSLQIRVF
jgi:hypothetical protein